MKYQEVTGPISILRWKRRVASGDGSSHVLRVYEVVMQPANGDIPCLSLPCGDNKRRTPLDLAGPLSCLYCTLDL